jgi:hypothetical protein
MMKTVTTALCLLGLLMAPAAAAALETRELGWEDLVPEMADFDDPFLELSDDVKADLGVVYRVRVLKQDTSEERVREADEVARKLTDSGIDVDGLLSRVDEIRELRRQRAEGIDLSLSGKSIRMGGYLLPLEFSGKATTEFLLVPYVGACIHTPPPPANQIVHVSYPPGFAAENLFTPVYVTGTMWARSSSKELFLVDGSRDIGVGYALDATGVELFR